MSKKRERPSWYLRMKRTTTFKQEISAALREWPCDGSSTAEAEVTVTLAFESWRIDMTELAP